MTHLPSFAMCNCIYICTTTIKCLDKLRKKVNTPKKMNLLATNNFFVSQISTINGVNAPASKQVVNSRAAIIILYLWGILLRGP